jgi:hypothetical protein
MARSYAKRVWHANWTWPTSEGTLSTMTPEEARAALTAAVRKRDAAKARWDTSRERLHDVIRQAIGPLTQSEIARLTGYNRERIRQLTPRPAKPGTDSRG